MVDAVFNGLSGNDLTVFLEMVIAFAKFHHCPIFECALVVQDELLAVIVRENG